MKTLRTGSGPFRERPFFKTGEIDRMCVEELRKVGLYPKTPSAIRIDRFLEMRFGIVAEYDDLAEGVLGYTKFGSKGVESIVIARALDEEGTEVSERRIRTTMAHEAGHGLLHAYLFALGGQVESLFGNETGTDCQILCRDVPGHGHSSRSYDGRWWEYQANQAIGGLLVPRSLAQEALKPFLVPSGSLGGSMLDVTLADAAAQTLSDVFEVNPAGVRIRINDLYPRANGGQLTL
jgi:hypothetical protein